MEDGVFPFDAVSVSTSNSGTTEPDKVSSSEIQKNISDNEQAVSCFFLYPHEKLTLFVSSRFQVNKEAFVLRTLRTHAVACLVDLAE